MKKTYINPTIQIVKIQTVQMLASSEQVGLRGDYNSGTVTIASREGRGFWDDDEEY